MSRIHAGLHGLFFVVSSLAAPAIAQEIRGGPPEGATPPDSQGHIADIIVTAQRRAERLQDVPISVSALRGASPIALQICGVFTIALCFVWVGAMIKIIVGSERERMANE